MPYLSIKLYFIIRSLYLTPSVIILICIYSLNKRVVINLLTIFITIVTSIVVKESIWYSLNIHLFSWEVYD